MRVEVEKIRPAYRNARLAFSRTSDFHARQEKYPLSEQEYTEKYFTAFGAVNGLTVLIDDWKSGWPVVNFIEFDSEQDYTWFMLRWS